MTVTAPPPQLQSAIDNAARIYHDPPDLLAGIWRVESGSSYPNPFANGLGYGGEFGTKITAPFGSASEVRRVPEPPVQEQANLAASILHNQLVVHNGNVSQALESYSGGGYSSVPGETTYGIVDPGAGTIMNPGYTPSQTQAGGFETQQAGLNLNPLSPGFWSPPSGLTGALTAPYKLAKAVWHVLTDRNTWIRVALIVGGGVIVIVGVKALVS